QDGGEEVACVRCVVRHVVVGAWVEELFAAGREWRGALVLQTEALPPLVVTGRMGLTREQLPAPLIDEQAKRQTHDLVERARTAIAPRMSSAGKGSRARCKSARRRAPCRARPSCGA